MHLCHEGYPPGLRERFNAAAEQLCISSITLGELHYGAEKSGRRSPNLLAIEHFTARLEVLPFTANAAPHHGQIRAELERMGRPAGVYDMLIGAHARSEGLAVVTNNTREFTRMPGLRVENWVLYQRPKPMTFYCRSSLRHGRACPGHPSWQSAASDGRDTPGHDGVTAAGESHQKRRLV